MVAFLLLFCSVLFPVSLSFCVPCFFVSFFGLPPHSVSVMVHAGSSMARYWRGMLPGVPCVPLCVCVRVCACVYVCVCVCSRLELPLFQPMEGKSPSLRGLGRVAVALCGSSIVPC